MANSKISGGFGSVFFFKCPNPNTMMMPDKLAVKKLKTDDKSTATNFEQEVEFWNKIHSKNPAYLYTHDSKESQLMIMPKIEGEDLVDLSLILIDTKLKIKIFLSIAIQLKEMHDLGMCHNDIHARNIKINIKNLDVTSNFIDFGLSSAYTTDQGNNDIYNLCIIGQYILKNESKTEMVKVINEVLSRGPMHSHSLDLLIETALNPGLNKKSKKGMKKR